jgi:hypothetical protein
MLVSCPLLARRDKSDAIEYNVIDRMERIFLALFMGRKKKNREDIIMKLSAQQSSSLE